MRRSGTIERGVGVVVLCALLAPQAFAGGLPQAGRAAASGAAIATPRGGLLPVLRIPGAERQIHFVPNTFAFWDDPRFFTTDDPPKPAYADVLLAPSNFLPCQGGPFALCYYSGPAGGAEDVSCTVTADGRFANCNCYEIPWGAYFVDINAILNYFVYRDTVAACGADGSGCAATNSAPVCAHVNRNTLIPGADLVSTFSFDCVPTDGIGQTDCSASTVPYAGCMTAPCYRTGEGDGIVQCSCPLFDGPYQVGLDGATCELGEDLVWSAAYAPAGATFPTPPQCIPDAPGTAGCPLYDPATTILPPDTDCAAVCAGYACTVNGLEPGFTCDATLCTGQCNDRELVSEACASLGQCPAANLAAIIALESAASCSCCASQLCGCDPSAATSAAMFDLNQAQRDRGITPQCDVNGTLCGTPG